MPEMRRRRVGTFPCDALPDLPGLAHRRVVAMVGECLVCRVVEARTAELVDSHGTVNERLAAVSAAPE